MSVKSIKVDDYEKSTAAYFNLIKNNKKLTKNEEKILWEKYHKQNDMSAREKLITANLKFVPTIAKQFKGCGLPFADIIEEGNIGLINAIDRFNPKNDNKVISYAVWWIRKSIIEAIHKKGVLNAENINDICQQSNASKKNLSEKNENVIECLTVYQKNIFDNNTPLIKKDIIEQLFTNIPERERFIVSDYYGLNGDTPKTLNEIGEELNLTKERVRQLNEKTLKKMRSNALVNISKNESL